MNLPLYDLNVSNTTLITIALVLGIVLMVLLALGRLPWWPRG